MENEGAPFTGVKAIRQRPQDASNQICKADLHLNFPLSTIHFQLNSLRIDALPLMQKVF